MKGLNRAELQHNGRLLPYNTMASLPSSFKICNYPAGGIFREKLKSFPEKYLELSLFRKSNRYLSLRIRFFKKGAFLKISLNFLKNASLKGYLATAS